MEAVPVSQLSEVLTQRLGGPAVDGHAWVSVERGLCRVTTCKQPFEWWLKAIIEAAKAWGANVIDESNPDYQTKDWLKQMTAKHVELNPIVAAFIGVLNQTIGHSFTRSKALTDPSTVPAYFPGPADMYAGRIQSMTLDQLIHVLQSIFDFIQVKHWGPQDIRKLRDALVAAAWHPLASSVGTWAGLNCCFEALAKKARDAGYADRGKAGLKKPGPNPNWTAIGPDGMHKIWTEEKKKKKSEQGSNGEVLPPGEKLREGEGLDEEEQEGGSANKRPREAKAATPARAGWRNGRQRGGQRRAPVRLARPSSGRATCGGSPPQDSVPDDGCAATLVKNAVGDDPGSLERVDSEELDGLAGLDPLLARVLSDVKNGAFDGLLMDGLRTQLDLDGVENGGQGWGSQPGHLSPGRPGTGSDASDSLHGDSANGALASSEEGPPRSPGALHFPKFNSLSPGLYGSNDAPPVYLPGDVVHTIPLQDFGSMDMDQSVAGHAAVPREGVGLNAAGASPNQRQEYGRQGYSGNGFFPAPGLEGHSLYSPVNSGPVASVLLGRARDPAPPGDLYPSHPLTAESQTRFVGNAAPAPGFPFGQSPGGPPYSPGHTPPSRGGSHSGAPYPGAPTNLPAPYHHPPSQAGHPWPPYHGLSAHGGRYPAHDEPPAGGTSPSYYQQQPASPAQHGGAQFLHSAGPNNDWHTLHAPQNGWPEPPVHSPGHFFASPAPTEHYDWGALHSPGWQPDGSGGQPMVVDRRNVPPRAAAPTAASGPSKSGSLINALLRSNPKPLVPNPGVVSDRGFPPGGGPFHAAQHPPVYNGHSATGGTALLRPEQQADPRGVHSAQSGQWETFRRVPSPRVQGASNWVAPPLHPHPAPAKTALEPPERQNEPSEVRSGQFRRQVSLGRGPLARIRRNASVKRALNPTPGRELEGEGASEAELAALVEFLKLEDRATGDPNPRARGIPLGRGRGAEAATVTEGDKDGASDGAEGDEWLDDSDSAASEYVTTDASGDESDGASGTGGPTIAGAVVKTKDTSSGFPGGAQAGANAGAYLPGERPPVSRREALQAAPATGAGTIRTGASTIPSRGSPPSSSARELRRNYQAKPNPEARLSSPGDRPGDHPAASLYKLQTSEVDEVPEAMKRLSAAAAAGIPANGIMNGTTASADPSGMHHGRWAPAPGGAPKRVDAERAYERADAFGHNWTASPSNVPPPVAAELFQPGPKMVTQATG